MSGLLFLTADDFNVVESNGNKILEHNVRGFTLVLFYSTNCVHCNKLLPILSAILYLYLLSYYLQSLTCEFFMILIINQSTIMRDALLIILL